MNIVATLAFLAATIAAAPPAANDEDQLPALAGAAEVDLAIAQLTLPKTRLSALEQLCDFAGMRIYQAGSGVFSSGDAELDALIDKAAAAVERHHDFETVGMALDSSRWRLQHWALWVFPVDSAKQAPWSALLPRLRTLATTAEPQVRGAAHRVLLDCGGHTAFLARCAEVETYLPNIMRQVYGGNGEGYHDRMNPHVLRLLGSPDVSVRGDALLFMGFNSHMAPMWQVKFTDPAFRRVLELSRSQTATERANAVYALGDLRKHDPAALRERMAQLIEDPTVDVRWRIPRVLSEQRDRADVQALFARLLRDDSGMVRYFTILELGPDKHVPELREIAAGQDRVAADFAAGKLKQLADKHN